MKRRERNIRLEIGLIKILVVPGFDYFTGRPFSCQSCQYALKEDKMIKLLPGILILMRHSCFGS